MTIRIISFIAFLAVIPAAGLSAGRDFPELFNSCLARSGYQPDKTLTPYFLTGDFYGDGKRSEAVLVSRNGARGILICDPPATRIRRLGAGQPFNGMANLTFDSWKVYPRGKVDQGVGEGPPPVLRGDAIWIEWTERASAIVYWNGHKFVWYQQGD